MPLVRFRNLLLTGGLNAVSVVMLQGTSFVFGLWAAQLMSKSEFGALQFLRAIQGYSAFAWLGVIDAVRFELAIAIGRNDQQEVRLIQRLCHTFVVGIGFLPIVVYAGLCASNVPLNGVEIAWSWLLLGVILALSSWVTFAQVLFQVREDFRRLGMLRLVYPVTFSAGAILLLPGWRISGFLAAMALGYAAMVAYGVWEHRSVLGFNWDNKRLLRYVKTGLPIHLNSFVWLLTTTVGLWLVSVLMGSQQAGVYGFAMLISAAYGVVPGILVEMGAPRLSAFFGRNHGHPSALARPVRDSLLGFAGINLLPAVLSLSAFDWVIAYWVPDYREASAIMLLLVGGYYANSVSALACNALILVRKERVLFYYSLAVLFIVVGAGVGLAGVLKSPAAVAAATLLGVAVNGALVARLLRNSFGAREWRVAVFKSAALVVSGYVLIVVCWLWSRSLEGVGSHLLFSASSLLLSLPHTAYGLLHLRRYWTRTAARPGELDRSGVVRGAWRGLD